MKTLVLTGGACAGKSTVLARLREEYGDKIVLVPESATMLLSSGFPVPGKDLPYTPEWQDAFQRAVCVLQLQLEASYALVAKLKGARLMVCDRALLDGAAYMQEGFEELLAEYGLSTEDIYRRYDQVIHLESVATCQPHLFGTTGNQQRYESLEEAQALELRTREAWRGHPSWSFISGAGGIVEVGDQVLAKVSPYLDNEVERKFWLPVLPEDLELGTGEVISQGYIVTEGSELRIRSRDSQTFITVKGEGGLSRQEWERPLPRAVFDQLWPATVGRRVEKIRYTLSDGDQALELDIYQGPLEGLITVEAEFFGEQEAAAYQLPFFLRETVEVTKQGGFKNKNLALNGLPSLK